MNTKEYAQLEKDLLRYIDHKINVIFKFINSDEIELDFRISIYNGHCYIKDINSLGSVIRVEIAMLMLKDLPYTLEFMKGS